MTPALRRRGSTLIEVAVALSVAAIVMLLARSLVEAVGDSARHVVTAAAKRDAQANSERTLRALLASAMLFDGDTAAFVGTSRFAAFRSWCRTPGGWKEPCSVTILIDTTSGSGSLALSIGGDSDPVVIRGGLASASLCYLESANEGGEWATIWARPGALPLALGVVSGRDTTILTIGQSA